MALKWSNPGSNEDSAPSRSGKGYRVRLGEDVNGRPDYECRDGDEFIGFAANADEARALAEDHEARTTRADAWKQYMLDNDPPKR